MQTPGNVGRWFRFQSSPQARSSREVQHKYNRRGYQSCNISSKPCEEQILLENFHHLHDGNFVRCHLHWNLREHFRKCWHDFIFPFTPNHNPTLNLPHLCSNHILIWTFSFQAHVWLKTINKLGLASLKTEQPGGLFGFTKLCWQPQFMKECCRFCKSLLSRYGPGQSRKEYRSDMFMGGCILAPGYFAEDFVALAIATHPSPGTLLPLGIHCRMQLSLLLLV